MDSTRIDSSRTADVSRRSFLRASGLVAVGGVLTLAPPATQAAVGKGQPVTQWDDLWRPASQKRLSDATHALARRAISGEYGRAMTHTGYEVSQADREKHSPDMQYALATQMVAARAPVRIEPHEKIVGSSPYLEAAAHGTPALPGIGSTSHTTPGFQRVLDTGYQGLRDQIDARLARGDMDAQGVDFLNASRICLDAASAWHQRYMDRLEELAAQSTGAERDNYLAVRRALTHVPEKPARNFREAVQSLWFAYAFQRLMGNWPGVGRIDDMLGPYLEKDLAAGDITLDEARELIAHLWIRGCEWAGAFSGRGTGDAQHYQNIILSGVDASGKDITNDVTYLVLDVVEELHISDFPIAVRLNSRSPQRLLERMADVQRHGGGVVAMYNEEVVIEGMTQFGYAPEEARTFTNDGCWECLIPGRTSFSYHPFDALQILQDTLALRDASQEAPAHATFDDLYAAFIARLETHIDAIQGGSDHAWNSGHPATLISLLVDDCIERGRGYNSRGSRYSVVAPHIGGMANVANSLLTVQRLVYEDGVLTLPEFVEILRNDWAGHEHLRRRVQKDIRFYGNDDADADAMVSRVFEDYAAIVAKVPERNGVKRPAGISTFGREIGWVPERTASPDGHRRGQILATNFSPSPGTDTAGPTAALRSYCKMDFTHTPNGATLELKLHPSTTQGKSGRDAMVALMRSFVALGGMFLHIDVVDSAMLLDAQKHPDKYPNLSVRISGWSARFATMNEDWQNMVIGRTQQAL